MSDIYEFTIAGRIGTDCRYSDVVDHLRNAKLAGQDVAITIDSPGGDIAEGFAIHNALRSFDGEVTAHIRVAASAAAIVALGCDHRVIAANGWLLLHPVASVVIGTVHSILAEASRLTRLDDALAAVVADAGVPIAKARELVAGESWLDASAALELALVHDISAPVAPAPSGPNGDQHTEAERRQSLAKAALTPRTPETLASNYAAFAAVVPTVPAIASAEQLPAPTNHAELDGFGEVGRRRREAIQIEAERVWRLSALAPYRSGVMAWACQNCGRHNTHSPGTGLSPTPCVNCRSTGTTIED